MAATNRLAGIVAKINLLPEFARPKALPVLFGKAVSFAGTTGIRIEALDQERCDFPQE